MKHAHRTGQSGRRTQRGNMAIEFAIVFPLFFVVFYAIVTYSLIFVAQQSLTLAAEEGARAALRFQANATSIDDALARRADAACAAANGLTNWLAGLAHCSAAPAPCDYDGTLRCIAVTLDYGYAARPLVPTLPLFGLALPDSLVARAMVQLDPDNVL
ncbi:TadE/TadG family type IV pilus assembly protein [Caballeronia insecticola]|uniref:TadE family protein n=1 Tax=Caballeronia insecticola TaxID=758793 RepID=R4X4F6_9BURK|nr:TadE/TadG family type IV pilus assembly protein [Caballeronia insecticola]BAN27242.1 TadE family protein [Caballeronia insecticola]